MIVPLDDILPQVTRPARYTGGEWNSIVKDWDATEVRIALIYPDVYEIGMSNLAIPILYDILNRDPAILAERAFTPWVDMTAALRQAGRPLFSLESRRPLKDFDILGFSLGYELTYTNVLEMLDLAGIPLLASERGEEHPLIIAGGSETLNPEPMADFIDLFVVGEGEEALPELLELYRTWKRGAGRKKEEFLRAALSVPGVYVPRFYRVAYNPDGTLASFIPTLPEAPAQVQRRIVDPLPPPPIRPIVPYLQAVHDRATLEVQRGCPRGCRFCQAGIIYRPLRERPMEEVLQAAEELLANTGYEELSLVSLSTGDYPGIDRLVRELTRRYRQGPLSISLPSLRLDSFSVALAQTLPGRRGGLTFAPEAGTGRLRQVLNKSLTDQDLTQAVETALQAGWTNLKFYFMMGLPTESEEDEAALVELARRLRRMAGEKGHHLQLKVSLALFIPKPHTPFQWLPQLTPEEAQPRLERLRQGLRRAGAHLSWADPRSSQLEAVLARGDRRLGRAIYRAWRKGCVFDAWSEHLQPQKWQEALAEEGLDPTFYAHRARPLEELLPWAHIDIGVSPEFLKGEYEKALAGQETPDCRTGPCSLCGMQHWDKDCPKRSGAASRGSQAHLK
ncbi:MAG: TIGR03960 family B12-binding radical SAM protein [Chloroflexi bacterium]|nr:TIGR03960 family B12-binding radical SAM protein [Chloroflexota bacterium]